MTIDYTAVSAWAAVAASLVAIIALLSESRRARFQAGVDMLLKFNDTFDSDGMCKARRRAAKGVRQATKDDAADVLDFFEMIALLVRRKAINELFVWHSFFYWIHRYYLITKDHVAAVRQDDPTMWEDLVWLHDRLVKLEKKRRRCSEQELVVSDEELNEFIEDEMKA